MRSSPGLWFIRYRWFALAATASYFFFEHSFAGERLNLGNVITLLGILAATNLILWSLVAQAGRAAKEFPNTIFAGTLVVDVALLTALLVLTGGPANPFSVLYLVHIIIAALLIGELWTWLIALLSISAFGALFFISPAEHSHSAMHAEPGLIGGQFSLHLVGMWVAFSLSGLLVAFFASRILRTLKAKEQELHIAQLDAEKNARFASLATLAAGTAHELGSPIGTIALISEEFSKLQREGRLPIDAEADVRLLSTEVRRCKTILDEMRGENGGFEFDITTFMTAAEFWGELENRLNESERRRVYFRTSAGGNRYLVQRFGLVRVVTAVVRNALEASPPEAPVVVSLEPVEEGFTVSIVDQGEGMSEEIRARAAEPFFTTKAKGMGLGLFLTRQFCERLGGRLEISSQEGKGTKILLAVPAMTPETIDSTDRSQDVGHERTTLNTRH